MLHGHFARPIKSKHRANAAPQWFEKSHLQLRVPNLGWAHRASKHVAGPSKRDLTPTSAAHHQTKSRPAVDAALANEGKVEKYQLKCPANPIRAADINESPPTTSFPQLSYWRRARGSRGPG